MKAEFKKTRTADGLPLTFGKMYDVLDVKAGKRPWQLKKIKVKNDLGQERWYSANKFNLFAEAAAFLKEPTAAGAGNPASEPCRPQKRVAIYCAGSDVEPIREALGTYAKSVKCIFGEEFVSEDCGDMDGVEDCKACVLKNIEIYAYD